MEKKQEAARRKERTHATHGKIHGLVSACPPQASVLSKRMERSRCYLRRNSALWLIHNVSLALRRRTNVMSTSEFCVSSSLHEANV